ncbi:MAG: MBOAT family protein [Propionibacteriaceae bacterium]|jgi:alginate O-acetyltransferase complex protein AlgI|nr:MBOAT family protein [Propionibacteriaceae bacterium]
MLFSSVPFLYWFLPLTLAVYFITPLPASGTTRWRNLVLLVASFIFYAWGEPIYVALMAAEVVALWGIGLLLARATTVRAKRGWVGTAVVIAIGVLGYFKYADFFINSFNTAFGLSIPLLRIALPIGISFYTFQMLSYIFDLSAERVTVQRNVLDFATYVVLFPQLVAGPIVRYSDVAAQLSTRSHTLQRFADGATRFTVGLAKKVLIANTIAELATIVAASDERTFLSAWLWVVAFSLQIYFDFSGYSDMAIGIGTMLGFDFPENFNYPYIALSITDFWRRWHMSLSSWFRDYVYIPLGGSRVKPIRHFGNIFAVWALTGFWHGADWRFIAWGLYFGVVLVIEKYAFGGRLLRLPAALAHIYTLLLICIGWVLFEIAGFGNAAALLGRMVGIGTAGLAGAESLYYLRSYAVLLTLGVLGATPLPRWIGERIAAWRIGSFTPSAVLRPIALALLLLLVTAFLVDGSFNPFIYFRF